MSNESSAPTVKKFMSQVLFTLESSMTLTDAAQFFASHKLTTIPVKDAKGDIIGVLSDFQLLRALLKARQENKPLTLGCVRDDLDPVVTIGEDESIVSAFRLMVQSPNHRIYAMQAGKLCGALSPKDVLLYMAGVKDKSDNVLNSVMQKQIEQILLELNEARRQLSDYQTLFHDSPYLMHSVDLNGKIIAANRMVHFVLGYDEGALLGKSLRHLYPPENYNEAMQGLEQVKKIGFHPMISTEMVKKDGDLVRVDIATTAKQDDRGVTIGTITVGRLSDSYRMINYLQRAAHLATKRSEASKKLSI